MTFQGYSSGNALCRAKVAIARYNATRGGYSRDGRKGQWAGKVPPPLEVSTITSKPIPACLEGQVPVSHLREPEVLPSEDILLEMIDRLLSFLVPPGV